MAVDYTPRNTSQDAQGRIRVRGKIVCEPRGQHIRAGSNFTPKGGYDAEHLAAIREANKRAAAGEELNDLGNNEAMQAQQDALAAAHDEEFA